MTEPLKTTCPLCGSEVEVTVTPQTGQKNSNVALNHKQAGCIVVQRGSYRQSDPRSKKVDKAIAKMLNSLFPPGSEDKYGL